MNSPLIQFDATSNNGITVLVCCYNSAARIGDTLRALARQEVSTYPELAIEVLVIDNASTDDTAQVAQSVFDETKFPFSYQILRENRSGKSNAIELGFARSLYKYIAIVDDDNWLAPDYLSRAWKLMESNLAIGVLGGIGEPVFETEPPAWFPSFAIAYATGPQYKEPGNITKKKHYLYGAGQIIRKQAWCLVQQAGFKTSVTGRSGKKLTSGEDNEMCYAIIFAGYEIWYDEHLHFKHFIPKARLNWSYVERLYDGNAASEVELRPWIHYLKKNRPIPGPVEKLIWLRNGLHALKYASQALKITIQKGELGKPGSIDSLTFRYYRDVFKEYLKKEATNDKGFYKVQDFILRLRELRQQL